MALDNSADPKSDPQRRKNFHSQGKTPVGAPHGSGRGGNDLDHFRNTDRMAAGGPAAGRLTRVFATHETQSSGSYAVYPSNCLLTPLVRLCVDHVASDLRAGRVAPWRCGPPRPCRGTA